jgi:hypothetical protein
MNIPFYFKEGNERVENLDKELALLTHSEINSWNHELKSQIR